MIQPWCGIIRDGIMKLQLNVALLRVVPSNTTALMFELLNRTTLEFLVLAVRLPASVSDLGLV